MNTKRSQSTRKRYGIEANSLAPEQSEAEKKLQEARDNMMGVDGMVNLDDFEVGTLSFHGPLLQKAGSGSISVKWSLKLIRWMRRKQKLARTILSPAALAYYESGSDDEWSKTRPFPFPHPDPLQSR